MAKFYGAGNWDPKLIVLQMTCMQVQYTVSPCLMNPVSRCLTRGLLSGL
jgi:hypothetical protein